MAGNFSQSGVQVQTQTQTLTPQQLLVSQLTEMPVEALYERVDQELKENVSLESDNDHDRDDWEADGFDGDGGEFTPTDDGERMDDRTADYRSPDDVPDHLPGIGDSGRDVTEAVVSETQSFYDQLEEQIGFFHLTPHEEEIIRYLIGSLDDDGLLRITLQQIQDELEVYHNLITSSDELERVLHVLQNFEPAGVGARSLQECLLLQVEHASDRDSATRQKLQTLLQKHFDNLMLKRWDRIQRSMRLTDTEVSRLQHEVRRLNPRPGSSMGEAIGKNLQQITPDFIIETDPYGRLSLSLNNGHVPPLRVSQDDLDFLHSYEGRKPEELSRSERDGVTYLRDRVGKARSFIEAIRQRQQTLMSTMETIMRLQKPFFESGDETLLRPMTLDDVARQAGLHLSTVSRVSSSKWVQTPFGIYPLKWFFTSAARLDGDDVSIRSIKAALREIVESEDKQNPLSDEALANALKKRGYDIARRTVTKYRVALNIPVARLRK